MTTGLSSTLKKKLCRELSRMMLYCLIVHPDGAFSAITEGAPLDTNFTQSEWFRSNAWDLASDLHRSVGDIAKNNGSKSYPALGDHSLAEMAATVKATRMDPSLVLDLVSVRDNIFEGARIFTRMYDLPTLSKPEAGTDDAFMRDYYLLWGFLGDALKAVYDKDFSIPPGLQEESVANLDVQSNLNPGQVACFLNIEIFHHLGRSTDWIKFSLEGDELLRGKPLVLVLLAWALAITSVGPAALNLLLASQDTREKILALYDLVKIKRIADDDEMKALIYLLEDDIVEV